MKANLILAGMFLSGVVLAVAFQGYRYANTSATTASAASTSVS